MLSIFCIVRMMQGLEYILLHVQDPILFIIRKQHRHSPTQGKNIEKKINCLHPEIWNLSLSEMIQQTFQITS